MKNKYLLLGHLTFFLLFIFAFLFGNERVLFIDSGAQVFELIRDEGFEIYAQRYSMYLFQLLPVLMIKLHAPLAAVIYSYSLSFLIIAYILWLITVYFLKNQSIGILMLFVMLGIRQTFFHTISETFQLMFFATFLYAWIFQNRDYSSALRQSIYYLIALIFIALCVFIHPVSIFFVAFIIGIFILDKNKKIFQKVTLSVMSIAMILIKILITKEGSHDTTFMMSISDFFANLFSFFKLNTTKWFFKHLVDFYWIPLLMFVSSLIFYLKKKQYLYFAFISCFIVGFWLITVIIYAGGQGTIAMERSFLPLFFFCGLPFMVDVFPTLSKKWNTVFFVLLTVFIIGGFIKIAVTSKPYAKRLDKIEEIARLANQQGTKKLLIEMSTAEELFSVKTWELSMAKELSIRDQFFANNWGLGFESIMYTALKGQDSIVNMFVVEDQKYTEDIRYFDPDI